MKKFENMTQGNPKDSHKTPGKIQMNRTVLLFLSHEFQIVPQTPHSLFMTFEYLGMRLPLTDFPLPPPQKI